MGQPALTIKPERRGTRGGKLRDLPVRTLSPRTAVRVKGGFIEQDNLLEGDPDQPMTRRLARKI